MKNTIITSALALNLLASGAPAADKTDPPRRSSSTSTQSQVVTRNGKTDGTVTVTINNDGETQVKTWKIGDPFQTTRSRPITVQSKAKMEKVSWLGVAITEVSEDLGSQLPIAKGAGVRVRSAIAKSPADRAGIRPDDLIYKIDEQIIFNIPQFQSLVRSYKPGSEMDVTLFRKGKKQTVTAKPVLQEMLVDRPVSNPLRLTPPSPPATSAWRPTQTGTPNFTVRKPAHDVRKQIEEQRQKIEAWTRRSPTSRGFIVRPDGKTTYVKDVGNIHGEVRKQVEKALKDSKISDEALKAALAALDQSFQNQKKVIRKKTTSN